MGDSLFHLDDLLSNLYVMSLLELARKCTVTRDGVKSYLFH